MSNPQASDLYNQFIGTGPQRIGPGDSSTGWSRYEGSIPNAIYSPTPQSSTVPFWDVPSTVLGPIDTTFIAWDTIFFGGQPFPGLARVRSKKHKRIDKKLKSGSSSARLTFVGYGPAEIEVTLSIWTKNQFDLLQERMPMLLPKPGGTPDRTPISELANASKTEKGRQALARSPGSPEFSPIDISYPSLILMNIRSVIVVAVDALEPSTPKGVWNMKIHCLEYTQPLDADETTTPVGSGAYKATPAIKQGAPTQAASIQKPSNTQADVGPRNVTFR